MKWNRRAAKKGWKTLMGIINLENVIVVSWEVEYFPCLIENTQSTLNIQFTFAQTEEILVFPLG